MKKLIKSMFMLTALSTALLMTSCGDDAKTPDPESAAPTVTLNNDVKTGFISLSTDSVTLSIVASADVDRKIKKITITRAVSGQATATLSDKAYNAKDVVTSEIDVVGALNINEDDKITYAVTVKDDKDKTTTKTYELTVASMATSGQIILGAPSNTTNEYRFYGVADNFRRYRAGATGADLAKNNAAKIDFVYFYNSAGAVLNAIYSPDFAFGAGTGWNAEIATWPSKNKTIFKVASITPAAFNALNSVQFLTELDYIDFTVGGLDRIANLSANTVLAYKASNGKRGLILVVASSVSATGQITFVTKAEL
ncbi:MAG: hypothetical protein FGM41_02970 [Bacteroidetes bacterium]|nr:hypothetical protein [Bacteroidota bacterium]